jgi:hypothetical protein
MGRALFFSVFLAIAANVFAPAAIAVEHSGDALRITDTVTHRIAHATEAVALHPVIETSQQQVAQNSEDEAPGPDDRTDNAEGWAMLGQFFAFMGRYWMVLYALAIFAGAVTSVFTLRLAITIISSAPEKRLKEEVLIYAWIVIPAAVTLIVYSTKWYDTRLSAMFGMFALLAWSDTFGALIMGGRLRKLIAASWTAPAPISLLFATVAFSSIITVILVLFWFCDDLWLSSCNSTPYSLFSVCGLLRWQGVYLVAALLILLIACGAVMPADSNLVRANSRLATFFRIAFANYRAKRRKRRDEARRAFTDSTGAEPSSYPVPALYSAPVVEAMRLKLKRSQRTSVLGKVIFILDARMELTRDEYGLLRKYRLGNDVIYESSNRQRRKEQTLAHLEMTKGGSSLRDSAGTQMWGAVKSLFSLGRAGVSAATAALSLRVTIDSLLSGVHVECKSMNELLEAEGAIREAAQNLRGYLDIVVTFDGREEIVELR